MPKSSMAQESATAGKGLTMAMIKEATDNIRGAVKIIWPMGLPEYETVRKILDGAEDLTGTSHASAVMPPDSCPWWAGKEILRGKTLKDYAGPNKKTRIIAKLVHVSSSFVKFSPSCFWPEPTPESAERRRRPGPENPMSEKAQKEMMAYYFRKQEEHKVLAETRSIFFLYRSPSSPHPFGERSEKTKSN
ncbi:MAG: hypothetical protein BJ554DRAFT_2604 [Olpidium bornovanus]|uniref:Uncharacterized protein n=1 Tax=Olpidium bornovanus TaxID=278681 RepID=A0A8H8DLR3_9FUNG|nr:MAG: hypothetical protein BJ554DRAFT_2604 [Olpidium bornovanus]